MFKSIRFPTYSRYEGFWNPSNQTMEGFGCYTFPDGSIYHGYFENGRFQGHGTMKLFFPQKFLIKAVFDKGKCVKIIELTFGDGLEFFGKFRKDGTLNADKWHYCSKDDRRYFNEARTGLQHPGAHAFLTANKVPRSLHKGAYDTSHGAFYPRTGFITFTEQTSEKSKQSFVSCPKDREYIQKHYRLTKGTEEPIEPSPETIQQIVECNIAALCHRYETPMCRCETKMERDRYYNNLCPKHLRDDTKDKQEIEISPSDCDMTNSSSSSKSFSESSEQDTPLQIQQDNDERRKSDEAKTKSHISVFRQKEGVTNITRFSIYPPGQNAHLSF